MGLFDTLKRQAEQAARSATAQAGQNIAQGVKNAVSSALDYFEKNLQEGETK